MQRQLLITGAICAMLAVILGAFAAHGLKQSLGDYEKAIWQTAVDYQVYHSLGILLVALIGRVFDIETNKIGWLMFIGILLFSGSLYALSLTGLKSLGMITPLGGLSFIIAWGWLALRLWSLDPKAND